MDLLAGVLYCEDGDQRTSFSYFLEAFETFHQLFNQYGKR